VSRYLTVLVAESRHDTSLLASQELRRRNFVRTFVFVLYGTDLENESSAMQLKSTRAAGVRLCVIRMPGLSGHLCSRRLPRRNSLLTDLIPNLFEMSSAFGDRKYNKLVLFDVDGTLTPARQVCHYFTMIYFLSWLNAPVTDSFARNDSSPA
jgi:hypothetical protein